MLLRNSETELQRLVYFGRTKYDLLIKSINDKQLTKGPFIFHCNTGGVYVSQHIEWDQLSQKINIDFLLFPKWLFFQLNFGAKIVEIGHCVHEIWQFH